MKDRVWKHRIVLSLSIILLVQVPFVSLRLTTLDQEPLYALVEAAHILVSSGLAGYLFSKTFDSLLEKWLYGSYLRRNWQEVRVMYSDEVFKGMGDAYPREPTLLIQPPTDTRSRSSPYRDESRIVARSVNGRNYVITAPDLHGPMSISFNTGYVGQPTDDENTVVTGKWSDLRLMQSGGPGFVRVGFPDTLIELGRPPEK